MYSWLQQTIKSILDRFFAVLLLVLCLPFFLFIGLLVKLGDGGPILFSQERPGRNEKLFSVWKFRSMVPGADSLLDGSGRVKNVNRVTRVGKFLRLTSLDELPQLINIVKGEMSFIGPRPALPEHLERYTTEQRRRYEMRPGVTGLAQVNGRNTLPWSKRIEYDVQYIDNYSLWLDIKIFVKTIWVVVLRQGIVLDRNVDQVDDLAPIGATNKSEKIVIK